ncbi:MAG: DUF2065 domain-containing protein [Proteobacteria bacterium]|nr:DUF2065 domain-containing protein [Pseudomonadota bacterium]
MPPRASAEVDWQTIFLALGLVLILEGAGYAAFPGQMRRMMGYLMQTGDETLRMIGLAAVFVGLAVIWFIPG